ncbi:homoprotocatechuate degradation operon regulator HpaR [Rhizobacter sp. AJA081-3]|uniref:homoprotocatechuate degradation operon regulator HpaR n=1 Tax=Rhizobacter sp. AJA081-3 TaxID=2753607 RepID=UPI001AE0741E|nr:homoprotocatechuate degradation operon regulator HpaR [Rhizobacter sp. AJA081-3]QTN25733.1 homoprotocatechuate degradation operon regulator HpaR [Rhizobacter sp. AJA081-3]
MKSSGPPHLRFVHRNLPLLLLHAREGVLSRFRPIFNSHDLTDQQWRILRALLECGPLESWQIGQACCISSSSIAVILGRMELQGLIEKQRMEHDQRRVLVSATTHSRALAKQMRPRIEAEYVKLEALVGKELLNELHRVLDAVNQRLSEAGVQPASKEE